MSINLAKQVQTTEINYEGPLANNYGGKYAKVKYQGRWLLVQTPKMLAPYGMSIYEEKDSKGNPTGRKTYSLDVSFNGYQPAENSDSDEPQRPSVRQMYDLVDILYIASDKYVVWLIYCTWVATNMWFG